MGLYIVSRYKQANGYIRVRLSNGERMRKRSWELGKQAKWMGIAEAV